MVLWGKQRQSRISGTPNRLKRFKNQAKRKVSYQTQFEIIWQRYAAFWAMYGFWTRRILGIAVILGSIAAFIAWLSHPQTLPILKLQVVGNQRTDLAQLQHTIAPVATGSFFQVDVVQVRQQVFSLPWVKAVTVQKIWSDTLLITLTEYQAVARWDAHTFVDIEGKLFVLPQNEPQPTDLPIFTGQVDDASEILAHYQRWQPLLQAAAMGIQEIGCNARRAWYIILNNKIKLLLGRDDGEQRIQRFIQLHPRMKLAPPVLIDLRYRSGIAVR